MPGRLQDKDLIAVTVRSAFTTRRTEHRHRHDHRCTGRKADSDLRHIFREYREGGLIEVELFNSLSRSRSRATALVRRQRDVGLLMIDARDRCNRQSGVQNYAVDIGAASQSAATTATSVPQPGDSGTSTWDRQHRGRRLPVQGRSGGGLFSSGGS